MGLFPNVQLAKNSIISAATNATAAASPASHPYGDALPSTDYVNVELSIDPNWPHLSQLRAGGGAPFQLQYTGLLFVFVSLAEQGFSESVGVNYATTDVVGRGEQYKTFTGTTNREISMTFHFVTQGNDQNSINDTPEVDAFSEATSAIPTGNVDSFQYTATGSPNDETILPARWIDSLKSPIVDPSTGLSYAPPPLILSVGNLLTARVILTASSIRWQPPFEPGTMYPFAAEVACTFTVVRTNGAAATTGNTDQYSTFVSYGPAQVASVSTVDMVNSLIQELQKTGITPSL